MSVENFGTLREIALVHEGDQTLHGFSLIDRIDDHAFKPGAETNCLFGCRRWNAVARIGIILEKNDVFGSDLPAEYDQCCGILRDLEHLRPGLLRRKGGIYADDIALATVLGEAHKHA